MFIQRAKKQFDFKFFSNFAYSGPNASQLSQRDLEEHIQTLSAEDQKLLVISMINSSYELNEIIPNIELLFYKMFISPITTKAQRKRADVDDLLAGNLFHDQDFKMPK